MDELDCEFREELLGHGFGCCVDQTGAELREFAADLCAHHVTEQSSTRSLFEDNLGAAFREAGNAALPFSGNRIAVRRIEI